MSQDLTQSFYDLQQKAEHATEDGVVLKVTGDVKEHIILVNSTPPVLIPDNPDSLAGVLNPSQLHFPGGSQGIKDADEMIDWIVTNKVKKD